MTALSAPQADATLDRFSQAARVLDLSQAQQARLLGLSGRTYRRRLKARRLAPREARVAAFLPRALEKRKVRITAKSDPDRHRSRPLIGG